MANLLPMLRPWLCLLAAMAAVSAPWSPADALGMNWGTQATHPLPPKIVAQLLREEAPDVLCLQECKSPVDKIPTEAFGALGYTHMVARGQKGYNGVAILSRLPLEDAGRQDFAALGHARHVAARLENGVVIHNHYIPAGGDVADRAVNEKFGQKLDYLTELRDSFRAEAPTRAILVGDLNIAPREDDVWDHKKLLKVVSHTPIEVEHFNAVMEAGAWAGWGPNPGE